MTWENRWNKLFHSKNLGDLIINTQVNKSTRILLKCVKKHLILNLKLLLVILTNMTTHSFKTTSSSILNLLHVNVRLRLREQLWKIYTSNLNVNWMQQFHFDHRIFWINIGLWLMLQEWLGNFKSMCNTLLSCCLRKHALRLAYYIVYLRCK